MTFPEDLVESVLIPATNAHMTNPIMLGEFYKWHGCNWIEKGWLVRLCRDKKTPVLVGVCSWQCNDRSLFIGADWRSIFISGMLDGEEHFLWGLMGPSYVMKMMAREGRYLQMRVVES
jgi:hypothetical protein